ncbi:MAG: metallophosphoesterase [Prevotella sp.]
MSDLYFDQIYWKHHNFYKLWVRVLWWSPGLLMVVYTIYLGFLRNYIPDDMTVINTYMFLVGLIVIPKALAAILSSGGWAWKRLRHTRHNWGNYAALFLCLWMWLVLIYGFTRGITNFKVRHVNVFFKDLPQSFDGYRIAQFSDAHLGTFDGWRYGVLQEAMDSLNTSNADLIVFNGDIQNAKPQELHRFNQLMSGLRAKNGVISVLGNHDYSKYTEEEPSVETRNRQATINTECQWGWRLLNNEHVTLYRGQDSIVIAGEQNYANPDSADFQKTMHGVADNAFVVLLQHDPKAWDDYIRPSNRIKLTLSGHTHGGQATLFGLHFIRAVYKQDYGLFEEDGQFLYVSSGIGALVPFRFGMPPEIAIITLHRK